MNTENSTRKVGIPRLIEIAETKKWYLFASMFLAVIATCIQFIPIISIYYIIEELALHANDVSLINNDVLYYWGYVSLGSVAVFGIILYIALMLSHIAAFTILYHIRVKIAEKLSRMSMGFYSKRTSGEIQKVLSDDVEKIELFIAHYIPDITSALIFPLLIIVFLLYMNVWLAFAALVPFPLAIGFVMSFMGEGSRKRYIEYHDALEGMNSAVVEYVRGMPVVKVFGSSLDSFSRLKDSVNHYKKWVLELTKKYSVAYPIFLTVASSSLIFIVPASVYMLSTLGASEQLILTILFFMIVGGGFYFPMLKLMFMSGFINQIVIGVERIDNILYLDEIEDSDKGLIPEDASIELQHVSFAYDDVNVLDDVSFTAHPGTVTALVGPSGAGKSTIGLLLARFWDIKDGSILIGGHDIKDISIHSLMDHVSFVFQDNFLFFDTIEENIRMGNADATFEEVKAAAKAAQCHDFIEQLPRGYQTLVGEGGTYLSGGEQQRVNIARIILKDSSIIVLDEATAYADPENEGKILKAISRLISEKTVLIIAHRLSTITTADQILVVDNGKIVESGTHDALLERKGLYNTMWTTYTKARSWTISKKGGDVQ